MAKLYVHQTPTRIVPAFRIPDEWISGWPEHGFEHVFRFMVPAWAPPTYARGIEPVDVLAVVPTVTVEIVKAYRNETPVPHIVLLGGGRWLVGHPLIEELEYAAAAPV